MSGSYWAMCQMEEIKEKKIKKLRKNGNETSDKVGKWEELPHFWDQIWWDEKREKERKEKMKEKRKRKKEKRKKKKK